ncbi:MAG: hypothetical protein ABIR96_05240 [Bdellovibrionota bacterium]
MTQMRGHRIGAALMALAILLAPFAAYAQDNACHDEMSALAAESSQNPLLKLRQQVLDDSPFGLKTKAREITEKLSECFRSKKLTRAQQIQSQLNLGLNLVVPATSIIWSHSVSAKEAEASGKKPPDFPFDLLGTVIVLYAWQSLIQCQNEMMPDAKPDASFMERSFDKYKRYFKMDAGGAVLYMGAILSEDLLRGHEVVSEEQMQELAGEGAFGFAWDTGMSIAHVLIIDKILMRYLPGGRGWVSALIKKKLFTGRFAQIQGKKVLLLKTEHWAEAPGLVIDFLIRQGYISSRSFGFVQLRDALFEDKDSKN